MNFTATNATVLKQLGAKRIRVKYNWLGKEQESNVWYYIDGKIFRPSFLAHDSDYYEWSGEVTIVDESDLYP